jgi:mannosylglucosylglycerate synthase
MEKRGCRVGILHYSAPPIVGGVENVLKAHVRLFLEAGCTVTVLAGRAEMDALPNGAALIHIPELDSQHPQIKAMSQQLEKKQVPDVFETMVERLTRLLVPALSSIDILIVHNVFTKHFNLPLTAALFHLLDQNSITYCVAWCHDITWTSPNSRRKVFDGYPWDLLRTYRSDVTYVAVSRTRQQELAGLYACPEERIHVIYNGVDLQELLALSPDGLALIKRLDLHSCELALLMPVRVTQAKNIELALRVAAAMKAMGIFTRFIVTGPPDPHDPKNMEYFRRLLSLRSELGVEDELRFVYESSPNKSEPLVIEFPLVAELYRVSDALFLPSHREGFGMSVLEAGLVGLPVFCADTVPAAEEIAAQDAVMFSPDANPEQVADLILHTMNANPVHRLKQHVRRDLTWESIFQKEILPLLEKVAS